MKIDFNARLLPNGMYYVTEREARDLCKESDPNRHHVPLLPKFGWLRKIRHDGVGYWIGLRKIDGKLVWTLQELD